MSLWLMLAKFGRSQPKFDQHRPALAKARPMLVTPANYSATRAKSLTTAANVGRNVPFVFANMAQSGQAWQKNAPVPPEFAEY